MEARTHTATVTSDNRQPTTDNRQPTTDNRQPTTNIIPLRSHVAAGVRHKPLYYVEVTLDTCQQKGREATLMTAKKMKGNGA
jgi:hypothetical protein